MNLANLEQIALSKINNIQRYFQLIYFIYIFHILIGTTFLAVFLLVHFYLYPILLMIAITILGFIGIVILKNSYVNEIRKIKYLFLVLFADLVFGFWYLYHLFIHKYYFDFFLRLISIFCIIFIGYVLTRIGFKLAEQKSEQ